MVIDLAIDYDCTFAQFIGRNIEMGTTDKWVTPHTDEAINILKKEFNLDCELNNKIKVKNEIAGKIMDSFRKHKLSIIYGGFER